MKEIELTRGYVSLVDDEDYEYLKEFKWNAHKTGSGKLYASGNHGGGFRKIHRVVMNVSDRKLQVDHINGNSLDNRKENLRVCTQKQNAKNRKPWRKSSSKYLGVSWSAEAGKWSVYIMSNGVSKYLGRYLDEVEAARVYDNEAKKLHKEFANLNFK